MKLEDKINDSIKESMLKQENEKLEALRAIKTNILNEKAKDGRTELSDEEILKLIQRMVNQCKESIRQYSEGNRFDLAEHEQFLIDIYQAYLPEQLSTEEITEKVKEIISIVGASSIRDMGKVMSEATKFFAGKADNKTVGLIVKNILS